MVWTTGHQSGEGTACFENVGADLVPTQIGKLKQDGR